MSTEAAEKRAYMRNYFRNRRARERLIKSKGGKALLKIAEESPEYQLMTPEQQEKQKTQIIDSLQAQLHELETAIDLMIEVKAKQYALDLSELFSMKFVEAQLLRDLLKAKVEVKPDNVRALRVVEKEKDYLGAAAYLDRAAGNLESESDHDARLAEERLQVKKDNAEAHRHGNFKGQSPELNLPPVTKTEYKVEWIKEKTKNVDHSRV